MAEDTRDVTNMINIIAHSIAKHLSDRMDTLAEEMTKVTTVGEKGYMPLSNYTCPICGVKNLQPLRRKWLFFKYGRPIAGYACQTEHCPAKGIFIPPELVQAALDTMTDNADSREEDI